MHSSFEYESYFTQVVSIIWRSQVLTPITFGEFQFVRLVHETGLIAEPNRLFKLRWDNLGEMFIYWSILHLHQENL